MKRRTELARLLAPASAPTGYVSRRINIPADLTMVAAVSEALSRPTFPTAWDNRPGGLTAEQAAEIYTEGWASYLTLDPPFFDSEDTVAVEQADYPFYEKASDWIVTAFLALTLTPAAAILYRTTIPQARIAFRKGQFGAFIKVLVDGTEQLTVDTYAPAPELAFLNVDLQAIGGVGEHEIRIEHGGGANPSSALHPTMGGYLMEIVRGDVRDVMPSNVIVTDPDDSGRNVISPTPGTTGLTIKNNSAYSAMQKWTDEDDSEIAGMYTDGLYLTGGLFISSLMEKIDGGKIMNMSANYLELAEGFSFLDIRPGGDPTVGIAPGAIGFFGNYPVSRPTVTGSRSDGTALASLLTALAALGLIQDDSTP